MELRARMDKLQHIADHYGIEVEHHEENKENYEKLSKELIVLEKQKKIVLSAVDTMTKRYEGQLSDKRKEYEQLYIKKATILKGYNERVRALRTKGLEIQDLIIKAKTEGAAEKGLLEILNKWEEANAKIIDRNEDEDFNDEATELSLLEAAHTELNKAKESQVVSDGGVKLKAVQNKKKKA